LLAVELAVQLARDAGSTVTALLALGFFIVSAFFVYRSFYGMSIGAAQVSSAREEVAVKAQR
jgi:K(+)-stimulated pyrophosphate-energized sodium pump